MRQPWQSRLKKGSGTFHPGVHSAEIPLFAAQSYCRKQDNINFAEKLFFKLILGKLHSIGHILHGQGRPVDRFRGSYRAKALNEGLDVLIWDG
jgi:hypothetical protein